MNRGHVRDPRVSAREFWGWLLFSGAAIAFLYVVLPWMITHPLSLCVTVFTFATVIVTAACMLASKISQSLGE